MLETLDRKSAIAADEKEKAGKLGNLYDQL
jgi:hypothetical protein